MATPLEQLTDIFYMRMNSRNRLVIPNDADERTRKICGFLDKLEGSPLKENFNPNFDEYARGDSIYDSFGKDDVRTFDFSRYHPVWYTFRDPRREALIRFFYIAKALSSETDTFDRILDFTADYEPNGRTFNDGPSINVGLVIDATPHPKFKHNFTQYPKANLETVILAFCWMLDNANYVTRRLRDDDQFVKDFLGYAERYQGTARDCLICEVERINHTINPIYYAKVFYALNQDAVHKALADFAGEEQIRYMRILGELARNSEDAEVVAQVVNAAHSWKNGFGDFLLIALKTAKFSVEEIYQSGPVYKEPPEIARMLKETAELALAGNVEGVYNLTWVKADPKDRKKVVPDYGGSGLGC